MMATFTWQLDRAMECPDIQLNICPDIQLNIILSASGRMFLGGINI